MMVPDYHAAPGLALEIITQCYAVSQARRCTLSGILIILDRFIYTLPLDQLGADTKQRSYLGPTTIHHSQY